MSAMEVDSETATAAGGDKPAEEEKKGPPPPRFEIKKCAFRRLSKPARPNPLPERGL